MSTFGFSDQRRMSHGVAVNSSVKEILINQIPGAVKVWPSKEADDRNGTDWWVHCEAGHDLSVDVKARSEDYLALKGEDDLALELWSDIDRKIPGWTLRTDKRTDYILWFWSDSGRWCLVPFPMLCRVFNKNRIAWSDAYQKAIQNTRERNRHWKSQCVFVPRKEVWASIYTHYAKGYLNRPPDATPPPDIKSLNGSQIDFLFPERGHA